MQEGSSVPRTDLLAPGLRVLFIGFNPSPASYAQDLNYAGRNNRFYRVLHLAGLTPVLHTPDDSREFIARYRFGFTNLSPRPTARADQISEAEYAAGRERVLRVLRQLRPRIACYVGKGVYERVARRRSGVAWGWQPTDVVDGVLDFVAPSTSGLVRMSLAEQVAIYRKLAEGVEPLHQ
jgi:TDG/mug DNA glycosylase family protein